MSKYSEAQNIIHHINASGGAGGSDTLSLCEAIDPDVSDAVVELVASHRNSDGSFRTVTDPADKAARQRELASLASMR